MRNSKLAQYHLIQIVIQILNARCGCTLLFLVRDLVLALAFMKTSIMYTGFKGEDKGLEEKRQGGSVPVL